MRKSLTCLLVFVMVFSMSISVSADALTDILAMYGGTTNSIDFNTFQNSLNTAKAEYYDLLNQWHRDEYFRRAQEVSEYIEGDSMDLLVKLDMDRRYLISLVNVEAELELIFAAENEYRTTLQECGESVFGRTFFDLEEFSLSGVTSSEVNAAVDAINNIIEEMSTYSIRPNIGSLQKLVSPTKGVWKVTSGYGYRANPLTGVGREFHNGLDLAAPMGTDVLGLFGGKIIYAGNKGDSLGNYILVSHSNEFQTLYAHLSKIEVSTGDTISQYDKIGEVGSTGRSTGPHLHLAVYVGGSTVDPMRLFKSEE